jgi:hypothetical protein
MISFHQPNEIVVLVKSSKDIDFAFVDELAMTIPSYFHDTYLFPLLFLGLRVIHI